MTKLPMMPLYPDAFIADTTHLTAEETGAYMLLLMAMWRRNGSIPDDHEGMRQISRVHPKRWSRIHKRIMPFFTTLPNGELTQKRLAAEWKKAGGKAVEGSVSGLSDTLNRESDTPQSGGIRSASDSAKINDLSPISRARATISISNYKKIFVVLGTPAWQAWQELKPSPCVFSVEHHANGWWFSSEWPDTEAGMPNPNPFNRSFPPKRST